ncbi:Methylmalonyl-CoA mutase small subunit [Methyloligella halotolerans]|uniref:Methylmalonyl-CoA mutase small subunit n=1 Tax=Methyloligella halotolerans TaxID=1177755 RepID=A0A1E2RXB7_9HYPH|nr:methylmalonyl-CoA mutase subunit beta [Methyloligella halotolerans]ODA66886.1 Methylmalonyl-CoA mutase small subunit [Methyloligella halotolerans]
MAELSLAGDFPETTEAEWLALVEKFLKGMPFEKLQTRTYDGNLIEPLYQPAQGKEPIAGRHPRSPWGVMQRIDLPDAEAANKQVMDDLFNGAPGLQLVFQGSVGDYGYALKADKAALEAALKDVLLDKGVALELDLSPSAKDAADIIADMVSASEMKPETVDIRFGFDPLGALSVHGAMPGSWSDLAPHFAGKIKFLAEKGFKGPFAVADGRPVHAAGGSEGQELAFALSVAVAYLRALEEAGLSLDEARKMIFFRLAADQNQFLTIAKFRAVRRLWARIEEACGLDPEPVHVTAETAWRMMTKRDPYGNIVRTTIACAGAAIGGADTISVLPYTAALGNPRDHARRVARNTQLILTEESNLHQVSDPSAGSGALEAFTDDLCRSAWALFQEIDKSGGAYEALKAGIVQKHVAATRAERDQNVAKRKEAMIGTSDFPDLDEDKVEVDPARPMKPVSNPDIDPLVRYRLAEPYEALRDASDEALETTGKRPAIFLATIGKPADFVARVTFARSFFSAGGIAPILPEKPITTESGEPQTFTIEDTVKDFKDSGLKLICLCSSDKVYAEKAAEAAKALKDAGASFIYLAGKPKEGRDEMQSAGVDDFIFMGCDTLAVLQDAQQKLSVGS